MLGRGASDQALADLRSLVSGGALGPGARLPTERELSNRFGVNRATLRKALARLEMEGAITRNVGRGTFVSAPAKAGPGAVGASPIELMEARHALEPVFAREAALRARAEDLERLRLCLVRSEAAGDFATFEAWDVAFHDGVAEATHNPVFATIMQMLREMRSTPEWSRLKHASYSVELRDHYSVQHRAICEALEIRDAPGAALAMSKHMQTVRFTISGAQWLEPAGDTPKETRIEVPTA